MKLQYFADTDTLYIELRPGFSADTHDMATDILFDFDAGGEVIGMTFERASVRFDLATLDAESLPLKQRKAA